MNRRQNKTKSRRARLYFLVAVYGICNLALSRPIVEDGVLTATPSTSAASDAQWNFNGEYSYRDEARVVLAAHIQVVNTLTQAGKARLKKLLAERYMCQHKGRSQWLCRKHLHDQDLPERVLRRLEAKYLDTLEVRVGQLQGEPCVLYKGDTVVEWHVPQAIQVGAREFSSYRYMQNFQNGLLEKIKMGRAGTDSFREYVVEDEQRLSRRVSVFDSRLDMRYYVALEMEGVHRYPLVLPTTVFSRGGEFCRNEVFRQHYNKGK